MYIGNRKVVGAIAEENDCVVRVQLGPNALLPSIRCSQEKLDEKLRNARNDPFRLIDGVKYPFEDIVGEDYFTTVRSVVLKVHHGGLAGGDKVLRMKKRNNFMASDVIWYMTGILRDGTFVVKEGLAELSMQLRASDDPQHEIWCVPDGFEKEFESLNGLCAVTGPFTAGNLNPQGVVIRISSDVGRLHMAPGSIS